MKQLDFLRRLGLWVVSSKGGFYITLKPGRIQRKDRFFRNLGL